MEQEEVKKYLKQAFWDRAVDANLLNRVLQKEITSFDGITLDKIYLRLLQSYSWYTILDIVNSERIDEILAEGIVSKIWNKPLRLKYKYAGALLSLHA